jgi:hypothetical protein
VFTTVDCGEPVWTVIDAATPERFVRLNAAGVGTPLVLALSV